jgi:hypothetical protein
LQRFSKSHESPCLPELACVFFKTNKQQHSRGLKKRIAINAQVQRKIQGGWAAANGASVGAKQKRREKRNRKKQRNSVALNDGKDKAKTTQEEGGDPTRGIDRELTEVRRQFGDTQEEEEGGRGEKCMEEA